MSPEKTAATSISDHSGIAEQLLRVFEAFAKEFHEREIPGHFSNVMRDGKYLKGDTVGQEPERFVEEHLIWPTLSVLGYDYRPQPYGFPKWDKTTPDFSVLNLDLPFESVTVGEVKTPNKFEYAEDDLKAYFKRDLGDPTIGFATDGVTWLVLARPEKSTNHEEIARIDLSPAFRKLPSLHEEKESYDLMATRKSIAEMEALQKYFVKEQIIEWHDRVSPN